LSHADGSCVQLDKKVEEVKQAKADFQRTSDVYQHFHNDPVHTECI